MITNHVDIITATNIVDVIQQYVPDLKKKGTSHIACCPFHSEKSPSFSVSPAKQIYTCFGCGETGNVVSFLMNHQKMDFPEAIKTLSSYCNIPVEYKKMNEAERAAYDKKEKEQAAAYLAMHQVNSWYYQNTWNHCALHPDDIINIDGRTFKFSTIQDFKISYATGGNILVKTYKLKHWLLETLVSVGLVKQGERGAYDFFRERTLFPVFSLRGKEIGYTARKPQADKNKSNPKYINTGETAIYDKSRILFGIHQNHKAISKRGYAYLVEGAIDVITLYDIGIQNVVAPCGTALTVGQARQLKKFTSVVHLLFDGDSAGRKAIETKVPILLKEGFKVQVMLMPDGLDPDDMARNTIKKHLAKAQENKRNGRQAFEDAYDLAKADFKNYVDNRENIFDPIYWILENFWEDRNDHFKREEALDLAASLLSNVQKKSIREAYIKALIHPEWFGAVKGILKEKIAEIEDESFFSTDRYTIQQRRDLNEYGIFIKNNAYWRSTDNKGDHQISNFILEPVMQVLEQEGAKIIFDVQNERGQNFQLKMSTDDMVSMDSFRKILLRHGNFLFNEYAKKEDYIRVQRLIFDNIPAAHLISILGYNRKGFYAWGNGLTIDQEFIPVNEYGLVDYKNERFYLPAYSAISLNMEANDQEIDFSFHKNFIFVQEEKIAFKEWSRKMIVIHGKNAMIAICWELAALFRDLIHPQFKSFPHLNFFGPPTKGKSYLAWDMMYLFGIPNNPFVFKGGTHSAFFRLLMQKRNAVIWCDEYLNDIHPKIIEGIKTAFDGGGRDLGNANNKLTTTTTTINSALLFTGQQQPTIDIAMISRCISLNFDGSQINEKGREESAIVKKWRANGQLSQLVHEILSYRKAIIEKFPIFFDETKSIIKKKVGIEITDRIMNNHCIPVAVMQVLLDEGLEFGFKLADLIEFTVKTIRMKHSIIGNEDEVAMWWNIIETMIGTQLVNGKDFFIEQTTSVTSIRVDKDTTTEKRFEQPVKVLYLPYINAHGLYLREHRSRHNKTGLSPNDLRYYLKISSSYIGSIKGKKINGKSTACIAFDMDKMPFQLETTEEHKSRKSNAHEDSDTGQDVTISENSPF